MRGGYYYYHHFMGEENEAQSLRKLAKVTQRMTMLGFILRQPEIAFSRTVLKFRLNSMFV